MNYTGNCSLNLHNLQVLAFCVPLDASVYRRGIGRDNSKKKKKIRPLCLFESCPLAISSIRTDEYF